MINKFNYFGCSFETSRYKNFKYKNIFALLRAVAVFAIRHNFAVKNFQISNGKVTINKKLNIKEVLTKLHLQHESKSS